MPKKKQRIGSSKGFVLLILALIADITGLLLFETIIGNTLVAIIGSMMIPFIYWLSGVIGSTKGVAGQTESLKGFKPKNTLKGFITRYITNMLVEAIPVLGSFYPGFTIFVIRTNRMVGKDDEAYNKAQEEAEFERRKQQAKLAIQNEQTRKQVAVQVQSENQALENEAEMRAVGGRENNIDENSNKPTPPNETNAVPNDKQNYRRMAA